MVSQVLASICHFVEFVLSQSCRRNAESLESKVAVDENVKKNALIPSRGIREGIRFLVAMCKPHREEG